MSEERRKSPRRTWDEKVNALLYTRTLTEPQRERARNWLGATLTSHSYDKELRTFPTGIAIDFLESESGDAVWLLLDVEGDNGERGYHAYRKIPREPKRSWKRFGPRRPYRKREAPKHNDTSLVVPHDFDDEQEERTDLFDDEPSE